MITGHERLIVVLGMAHSGTTIMAYLLRQHPDVFCAVNGAEAWILENDWLPLEQTAPIQEILDQFPNHRILLKRPWSCVYHADWMAAEMPNARFLYCQREFAEISRSWSKPGSIVDLAVRHGTPEYHRRIYDDCLERSREFARRVPYFRTVEHRHLWQSPQATMADIATWLQLAQHDFDVSAVSPGQSIKAILLQGL